MSKRPKFTMTMPELDIFSTQEERDDAKLERVKLIPLEELYPFKNHPFHVNEDEELAKLADSIADHGVLTPALARPRQVGGYELISGHRRHAASILAGMETMPVVVREMDDDEATIAMVDANQQRGNLLPSEKGWAYRMKLEALKHQGKRHDRTSCQFGTKYRADNAVAKDTDESARTIQRYIRLTYLIQPLLDMVDAGSIGLNPGVELSYLKKEEQEYVADAIELNQSTPSHAQTIRMKELSKAGGLTMDEIYNIMGEQKPNQNPRLSLKMSEIAQFFPKDYTPAQMEDTILRLLKEARQRELPVPEQDDLEL